MNYKLSLCACLLCCNTFAAMADTPPFTVTSGLFDASQPLTMGLNYAPGAETVTVWAAQDQGNHYANGVVLAAFKGNMYCMWQTSAKDEDSQDTYVAYAISHDNGMTWSEPMVLCPTISNGYCASGGWLATGDLLIGYINVRTKDIANSGGYTQYVESSDGINWTQPKDVTMADGSQLNGIFEQDPHVLSDGRIIGAAHFQPGLKLCPIYTDDPTGRTGWKKGAFQYTDNGTQSAELEPSFFQQHDGTLVMVCRDQKGSYRTLAATSNDRGETWTKAVKTDMPDSRAKQCAGNLPDGTAFLVNNPGRVTNASNTTWRIPLTVALSADGTNFTQAYLLRSGQDGDYPARRYEGKAKTLGYSYPKAIVHDGYLYVSYATNKDDAQLTRVPLNNIMLGIGSPMIAANDLFTISGRHISLTHRGTVEIFDLRGTLVLGLNDITETCLEALPSGLYAIRIMSNGATVTRKVMLR